MGMLTTLGGLFKSGRKCRPLQGTSPLLGLDIGAQAVKLIQLTNANGRCSLKNAGVRSLSVGSGEEGWPESERAVEGAITDLVQECQIQRNKVACSLKGPAVIVKSIQVPKMTDRELEEHLQGELDQYISSDVSEVYWDYHILNLDHQVPSGMKMSVLLVAARKEAVKKRTELLHGLGLNPILLGVDTLALSNMYTFNYHRSSLYSVLLINVSPSGLGMIAISKGNPIFMREVECVSDGYRDLVKRAIRVPLQHWGGLDEDSVFDGLGCPFPDVNQEVLREVKNTLEFCCDMDPQYQLEKLFLCGGFAELPGLNKALEAEMMRPVEHINPFKNIEVPTEWENQNFFKGFKSLAGVAIGLGLYGLDDG